MSLILPPFYFADSVDNLDGAAPSATPGTNFTAGANNADGAAVAVLGALAFDVHYLAVGIGGVSVTGGNSQCLLDVLNDPAGGTSWSVKVADLLCGFTPIPTAGAIGIQQWYHFPLFIKSGNSIGVQARTAHTSNITTGRVIMYAYGNPSRPDRWWCGQGVESLGINAASSSGTSVTPTNGSWGSWTAIGTSTRPYGAVQLGLNGSDGSSTAINYHWQIGYGNQKCPGSPTYHCSSTTAEVSQKNGFGQIVWVRTPGSLVWRARGWASGTVENYNLAVYGVY